jgi:hypothetical protein
MKIAFTDYSNNKNIEDCFFQFAKYLSGKYCLVAIRNNNNFNNITGTLFSYEELIVIKNETLVIPYFIEGKKYSTLSRKFEYNTGIGFIKKIKELKN